MIRFRFEKASQIFCPENKTIILPLDEILANKEIKNKYKLIAEIPPVIWESNMKNVKDKLKELKNIGVYDVLAENIGAIALGKEFGFNIHGGFTLNILNSVSLKEYENLGLCDTALSVELSFANAKNIRNDIPVGMVTYGYLPMMKFRNCPTKDEIGCGNCTGNTMITDRKGEKFRIICRDRQYSELLNYVPLYVGDKSRPKLDFEILYFTVETKEACERIYNMYVEGKTPGFNRTSGLYFRELL